MKSLSHLSYKSVMKEIILFSKFKNDYNQYVIDSIVDAYFNMYHGFYKFNWKELNDSEKNKFVSEGHIYKLLNFNLLNFQFTKYNNFYKLTLNGKELIGVDLLFKKPIDLSLYNLYFIDLGYRIQLVLILKRCLGDEK